MSRIGKKPIGIPQGVDVTLEERMITTQGPLGTLAYTIPSGITVAIQDGQVVVTRANDQKRHKALHGLVRSLINNMLNGVATGFAKVLEIEGIGYRVTKQGETITLAVGYSHPVNVTAPKGITFNIEGQNRIIIKGFDKQLVGQIAAEIRSIRKPEPYKGKGIRYSNEVIRRKVGKTGA